MNDMPNEGDIIESCFGGRNDWERVVVLKRAWVTSDGRCNLHLKRHGKNQCGRALCPVWKGWPNKTLRRTADRIGMNIAADWLEENNFPKAAAALRQAFPLAPAQGQP